MAITTSPVFKGPISQLVIMLNRLWLEMATAVNILIATGPGVPATRLINAGNGLTGGGDLSADRTITLGTPSNVTLSSTNSVTATSHTHAFVPGGTSAQYIRGDGILAAFPSLSFLPLTGGTLTGQLTISTPGATIARLFLTAGSGVYKLVTFQTSGVGRWDVGSNNVAETGSDAGSNFQIRRYDDAGTFLGASLEITRATGVATFESSVFDMDGNVRKLQGRTSNAATNLTSADFNKYVEKSNTTAYTWTLDAGGSQGQAITLVNSGTAGNITIARAAGVALYSAGVDANITITPGSMRTIYKSATANRWIA